MYLYRSKVKTLAKMSKRKFVNVLKEKIEKNELLSIAFLENGEFNNREIASWENSVTRLVNVLYEGGYGELYVIMEYSLPYTQNRIDVVLAGEDHNGCPSILIVELKQWKSIEKHDDIEPVRVRIPEEKRADKKRMHPCAQIKIYRDILECHHNNVLNSRLKIEEISYLHNFEDKESLFSKQYKIYEQNYENRVFIKGEENKLIDFVSSYFAKKENKEAYKLLIRGKFQNSEDYFQSVEKFLSGKDNIKLLEEQTVLLSRIESLIDSRKTNEKLIFIISGAAGTGKSILGLYLFCNQYKKRGTGEDVIYATYNNALREVLNRSIQGDKNNKSITTPCLANQDQHSVDMVIVDEAQRMNDLNRDLEGLIRKSKIVVLLQDDSQIVRWREVGTRDNIVDAISRISDKISPIRVVDDLVLKTNLRMGCGCAFESVINEFLSDRIRIRKVNWDRASYKVEVASSFDELERMLQKQRKNNRCKLIASKCWKEISNSKGEVHPWVPFGEEAEWYINHKENRFFHQIGLVYASQGLDFDYVGIVVSDDLYWQGGKWNLNLAKNRDYKFIKEIVEAYGGKIGTNSYKEGKGFKVTYNKKKYYINEFIKIRNVDEKQIINLLKNVYRVLLTRAKNGIFIYFKHKGTQKRFEKLLKSGNVKL